MTLVAEVEIEAVTPADRRAVLDLLTAVGLPHDGLADRFDAGVIGRSGDEIVGSALLEIYGKAALLRSVAVAPQMQGRGLGARLTEAALAQARERGIERVYLLTETAEGFFPRFGFQPIDRADVDEAVQQSVEFASACPASAVAMMRIMSKE